MGIYNDGGNLTGLGEARFVNPQGTLTWAGTQASISVGPGGGGVGDGQLRLNKDDGVGLKRVRESRATLSGWQVGRPIHMDVEPSGHLGRRSLGGSSVGLDADTLDGFDSSEFLRAGALDGLDMDGGGLENVAVISPGGDPVNFNWIQTGLNHFADGQSTDVDVQSEPGDIRLLNQGGSSEVLGETGRLISITNG